MGALGSIGPAEHIPVGRTRGFESHHPGRNVASGDSHGSHIEGPLLVDRAIVNFIAIRGPIPHQSSLIIVDKVWLCRGQIDAFAANN